MSVANIVLASVFFVVAVALIVLGAMATMGKLPGNPVIGLRVPEVRKDKATWDQAHRALGPLWIFAGVSAAFAGAFSLIAQGWLWFIPLAFLGASVAAYSIAGNFGARAALLVDAARNPDHATNDAPSSPAPAVNLEALRKAAGQADQ
ncbi:SdpI family protein [Corynebacterium mayonis]|uniref:SdpI family protein n=1 Tax=Corynebacterium mayonis TaxID=3062461 RepID=UPI00314006F1